MELWKKRIELHDHEHVTVAYYPEDVFVLVVHRGELPENQFKQTIILTKEEAVEVAKLMLLAGNSRATPQGPPVAENA